MAFFYRPTRKAIRRSALAGFMVAALALLLAGCGGGGGSNYTHVEGFFLTPSGGLVEIPSVEIAPNPIPGPGAAVTLASVANPPATLPYFIELHSNAGDVNNGIQVSAISADSSKLQASPGANQPARPFPTGEGLVLGGGVIVTSSTSAGVNRPLTISLGYNPGGVAGVNLGTLHIFQYSLVTNTWNALTNNFVNMGSTAVAYSGDASLTTFPNTVTAQFSSFSATGQTYFAVLGLPSNGGTGTTPTLDPFFGTYRIDFTAASGTAPAFVYVDTGANIDASNQSTLSANTGNTQTVVVSGTLDATTGQTTGFAVTENNVAYALTGAFKTGNPPAGSGSYSATGASGTWTATRL